MPATFIHTMAACESILHTPSILFGSRILLLCLTGCAKHTPFSFSRSPAFFEARTPQHTIPLR